MHWSTLERLARERQTALLAEAHCLHLTLDARPRTPHARPGRRLARWLRALADRLDAPTRPAPQSGPCT